MDSMSWVLRTMLQWTWQCRPLFKILISISLAIYPELEVLGGKIAQCSIVSGTSLLLSLTAVLIYLSPNSAQGFPFLHILTKNCYPCIFDDRYSNRQEVISPCDFNLHFPADYNTEDFFHAPDGIVCPLLRKVYFTSGSFLNWPICFLAIELFSKLLIF